MINYINSKRFFMNYNIQKNKYWLSILSYNYWLCLERDSNAERRVGIYEKWLQGKKNYDMKIKQKSSIFLIKLDQKKKVLNIIQICYDRINLSFWQSDIAALKDEFNIAVKGKNKIVMKIRISYCYTSQCQFFKMNIGQMLKHTNQKKSFNLKSWSPDKNQFILRQKLIF